MSLDRDRTWRDGPSSRCDDRLGARLLDPDHPDGASAGDSEYDCAVIAPSRRLAASLRSASLASAPLLVARPDTSGRTGAFAGGGFVATESRDVLRGRPILPDDEADAKMER